jgi:hypothetical protein
MSLSTLHKFPYSFRSNMKFVVAQVCTTWSSAISEPEHWKRVRSFQPRFCFVLGWVGSCWIGLRCPTLGRVEFGWLGFGCFCLVVCLLLCLCFLLCFVRFPFCPFSVLCVSARRDHAAYPLFPFPVQRFRKHQKAHFNVFYREEVLKRGGLA